MSRFKVDNNTFLWFTRGKSWGFRFLSKPSGFSSAEKIYKKVFLTDEDYFGYWKGFLSSGNRKVYYIACRCYDEKESISDEAGRRIPHELLILCEDQNQQEEFALLSWGPALMDRIREAYLERYDLESEEINECNIHFELDSEDLPTAEHPCIITNVLLPDDNPVNSNAKNGIFQQEKSHKSILLWIVLLLFIAGMAGMAYRFQHKESSDQTDNEKNNEQPDGTKAGEKDTAEGKTVDGTPMDRLDELWNEAKAEEPKK